MSAPSLLLDAPACCEDEDWKPVPDWPHESSTCGRVRSVDRIDANGVLRLGAMLPRHPDKRPGKGYLYVMLLDGKRRRRIHVAVAVLEAHRELKPTAKHEARHGNGIRTDNHLANLSWTDKPQNRADREWHRMEREHGHAPPWIPPDGEPGVLVTLKEAISAGWLPPNWSDPAKVFSVAKIRAARAGALVPKAKARAEDGNTLMYDAAELTAFIRSVTASVTENRTKVVKSTVTVSQEPDFPVIPRHGNSVTSAGTGDTGSFRIPFNFPSLFLFVSPVLQSLRSWRTPR